VICGTAALRARRLSAEKHATPQSRAVWAALFLLASVSTVMMLRATSILWQILPKLRFVQFPWRWMAILAVPFSYFVTAAMTRKRLRWSWAAVLVAILVGTGGFMVKQTWWDEDDIPTLQAAVESGVGFDGVDEYDPVGDDHYNLPAKAPRTVILPAGDGGVPAGATVYVDRWTAEEKEIRVSAPEPVRIALRLVKYPGWRVEVNGVAVAPGRAEESDQMVVPVAAGESQIVVRFQRTTDRLVGVLITLASVFVGFLVWAWPFAGKFSGGRRSGA
jgi:hypothetical protein